VSGAARGAGQVLGGTISAASARGSGFAAPVGAGLGCRATSGRDTWSPDRYGGRGDRDTG